VDVAVGTAEVAVGRVDAAVGTAEVAVGSADVAVGSADVAVGSADVAVGSADIAVGCTEVIAGRPKIPRMVEGPRFDRLPIVLPPLPMRVAKPLLILNDAPGVAAEILPSVSRPPKALPPRIPPWLVALIPAPLLSPPPRASVELGASTIALAAISVPAISASRI